MAKVLPFLPNVPPPPKKAPPTVAQLLERAFMAHERGDRAKAEQGYLEILQRDPQDGALWYGMGRLAMEASDFEEGAVRFHRAITYGFTEPIAFVRLGWCHQILGRFEQALLALREAENRAPEDPAHPVNQAVVHARMENWELALACAQKSLALRETFVPGHLNAGAALVYLGREAEAVVHYQRALALEPENADAQAYLAALKG
jgi:tetratricopeptide (TPR) repeat protein